MGLSILGDPEADSRDGTKIQTFASPDLRPIPTICPWVPKDGVYPDNMTVLIGHCTNDQFQVSCGDVP